MGECVRPRDDAEWKAVLQAFRAKRRVTFSSLYWLPDALAEAVRAGRLWLCADDTALLLLRDEGTHYACALELTEDFSWPLPPMDKPVVCELVYTDKRPLADDLRQGLVRAGLTRLRTTLHFVSPLQTLCETPPEVRGATEVDLPRLRALLAAHFDPRLDFIPDDAELRDAQARGDLLALPRGDEIVGFAYAPVHNRRGVLRHIAVTPAYRGQGFSRLLMRAALARFAALGARSAELWSGEGNLAAHHLYRSFGFAPDGRKADEYVI